MNIFYLSKTASEAAKMHCDRHVVKMILETAQMLSTSHRILEGNEWADYVGMYKGTHKNHPSTVWVRSSVDHYKWTLDLLFHLGKNYTLRYGKIHKTMRLLDSLAVVPESIKDAGYTHTDATVPFVRIAHTTMAKKHTSRSGIIATHQSGGREYQTMNDPAWAREKVRLFEMFTVLLPAKARALTKALEAGDKVTAQEISAWLVEQGIDAEDAPY
jgi:hypothetical protein